MKKILFILVLLSVRLEPIHAENIPAKLNGNIIGTTEGYDYSTGKTSTTVNTAKAVFDGNLTTFLAAAQRSGGWAGLDLGSTHQITKIAYCPYVSHPERLVQGIFQGANRPDFMDAITLFTITTAPPTKLLTTQTINSPYVFRYIRYLGPDDSRCNIAEVEIHGYKAIGDSSTKINLPQLSKLPTVYIQTENSQDITSKDYYLKGLVFIISENGDSVFSDSIRIKGRGNFSWSQPKKPYRIKLDHKAHLLGMPAKAKDWTLINNYGDKTLMRNLLAFDLSKRLEMPYSPAGRSVDVVLNGKFNGCYQLCDQIEVGSGRVDVEKLDESCTPQDSIQGGYLVEMDAYASGETVWFTSARGIPVTVKYPDEDEITQKQKDFIKTHFDLMENTIYSNKTKAFDQFIDLNTFLRHFLIGEFSGNTDTYWSTYLYKYRNDTKFYIGPVWDFDLAYENDNRTYPINSKTDWVYRSGGSAAGGVRSLVDEVMYDNNAFKQLKTIWSHYRDLGVLSEHALLTVVDDYASNLEESQILNFERWPIMNQMVHQNPVIWGSYQAEVDNVKTYISNRLTWIDNKLSYVPGAVNQNGISTSDIHLWTEPNTLHLAGLGDHSNVEIVDMTGRRVQTNSCSGSLTSKLQAGSYLVHILDSRAGQVCLKCIIP